MYSVFPCEYKCTTTQLKAQGSIGKAAQYEYEYEYDQETEGFKLEQTEWKYMYKIQYTEYTTNGK